MTTYPIPGVYVREIPSGEHPITAVGTRTAAFLGTAPVDDVRVGEAVPIGTWTEFSDLFIRGSGESNNLASAVYGYFLNGGGRCYVVNLGRGGDLRKAGGANPLEAIDAFDDISIVAAPGMTDAGTYDALLSHCENPLRLDRMALLDTPNVGRDEITRLTLPTSASAEVDAAPEDRGEEDAEQPTETDEEETETPEQPSGSGGATGAAGGGAGGGAAGGGPAGGAAGGRRRAAEAQGGLRPRPSDDGYGAVYFPWIVIQDPLTGKTRAVPPSGHIAGVWARSDETRGVHKAPANETVRGAMGLAYRVSRADQERLHPAGVNCIREFPRDGIRVWGASTLAAQSSEWHYINVRRLVIMIRESIMAATNWVVFEPNDEILWRSIRRDVGAFLTQVWRDGGLFGTTPSDAFFVKCDAELNTKAKRDLGQVETLIGIAPVKPAEFVIFKIVQSTRSEDFVRSES